MRANKRNNINSQNLDEWLRSTGFLFPTNELELARFNKLYADYDFKLKDASIDVASIIEGHVCSCDTKGFGFIKYDESNMEEIEELKMAARKGHKVPEHIIDKMMQKHRKNGVDEKQ